MCSKWRNITITKSQFVNKTENKNYLKKMKKTKKRDKFVINGPRKVCSLVKMCCKLIEKAMQIYLHYFEQKHYERKSIPWNRMLFNEIHIQTEEENNLIKKQLCKSNTHSDSLFLRSIGRQDCSTVGVAASLINQNQKKWNLYSIAEKYIFCQRTVCHWGRTFVIIKIQFLFFFSQFLLFWSICDLVGVKCLTCINYNFHYFE